ncbi:MAG: mechanosensitive ion channel family protein, partial [Micrococcales bacterium]|nr:mechanosensitive ion channel family protein [Micrococcales bacterium]
MPLRSLPTLTWAQAGDWLIGAPLTILVTVVIAVVARWLVHRLIGRLVDSVANRGGEGYESVPGRSTIARAIGVSRERYAQRARALGSLLRSISTAVIFGIAALTVMAIIGIPLGPTLASAGVGGVALGFGAQSLVKDFLSGIFMIIEDQYGVGDVIDTGEAIGTVETVSLRVTRLRDFTGIVWYVRNGEIVRIGNRSKGWSTALVDVPIAYDEDPERAQRIIREVSAAMFANDSGNTGDADQGAGHAGQGAGRMLEEPTVAGIEAIADGAITIRVIAKCAPQEHFGVQRELRERIKLAFDREGV